MRFTLKDVEARIHVPKDAKISFARVTVAVAPPPQNLVIETLSLIHI